MNDTAVSEAIVRMFEGVDTVVASDNLFFFYNPDDGGPPDHRLPFATLMTNDENDPASNLGRPGVFRLNIGVKPKTYAALFGPPPKPAPDWGVLDTGHNYTRLDTLMPHPIYAPLSWMCVLNPSAATFQTLRPLLEEAYTLAVRRRKTG